ncbi:MAG: rod shape-determining protein, partial [Bacteroidales bacterium]|nr:rod shape-determining protein [Bacteroidales bacterium]
MGAFSFLHTELGIDLGTANIVIIYNDKEALNMPSMIAMNKTTNKAIAVGDEAREMYGKTHDGIEVIRPLRGGVIADFNAAELMLIEMIKKVKKKTSVFPSSLRLLICIPSGRTQVEERSVREAAERAGAREVKLILEPMAAALGVGINVTAPVGNMIVDIGGGTSEIAVISLGGIVAQASIRAAGDNFNQDIIDYMRRVKDIHIGERS